MMGHVMRSGLARTFPGRSLKILLESSVGEILKAESGIGTKKKKDPTFGEASKLFLKKRSKWNHGAEVQPVELPGSSSVRGSFTQEIHNKKPAAISAYWQKLIFAGRATPPPEKGSDAEVIAYVQANPGAIGYVSSGASVSGGL